MRKLARIVKIDSVAKHPNADTLELCKVGGWQVVSKLGSFCVGDIAVYFEIDSWIEHDIAPFLSIGRSPREYNGIKGNRLKTVSLRGEISQGLLLPISILPSTTNIVEGEDVTDILNVQKWEAPIPANLSGSIQGPFPSFCPKTEQERIQNLTTSLENWVANEQVVYIEEKLEGTSASYIFKDGEFFICQRNWAIKDTDNTLCNLARELDIKQKLQQLGRNIALQGEVVGPKIQENIYKLNKPQFYLFDIYDIDKQAYLGLEDKLVLIEHLKLPHVPVISKNYKLTGTVDDILKMAEGVSCLYNTEREGLVFKQIDGRFSFKSISNKYLINSK